MPRLVQPAGSRCGGGSPAAAPSISTPGWSVPRWCCRRHTRRRAPGCRTCTRRFWMGWWRPAVTWAWTPSVTHAPYGSAGARSPGSRPTETAQATLVHGTLLVDADLDALVACIAGPRGGELDGAPRPSPSRPDRVANVGGEVVAAEAAIVAAFPEALPIVHEQLSPGGRPGGGASRIPLRPSRLARRPVEGGHAGRGSRCCSAGDRLRRMETKVFTYARRLEWIGGRRSVARAGGRPEIVVAPPVDFPSGEDGRVEPGAPVPGARCSRARCSRSWPTAPTTGSRS